MRFFGQVKRAGTENRFPTQKSLITAAAHECLSEENACFDSESDEINTVSAVPVFSLKHSCFLCGLFSHHTNGVPGVFNTRVNQIPSGVTHLSTPPT